MTRIPYKTIKEYHKEFKIEYQYEYLGLQYFRRIINILEKRGRRNMSKEVIQFDKVYLN